MFVPRLVNSLCTAENSKDLQSSSFNTKIGARVVMGRVPKTRRIWVMVFPGTGRAGSEVDPDRADPGKLNRVPGAYRVLYSS